MKMLSIRGWVPFASFAIALIALGAGVCYGVLHLAGFLAPASIGGTTEKAPAQTDEKWVVRMPEEKWASAGIRVANVEQTTFVERAWRSGRLALNETRIAHIMPMVEGIVREVKVRLGQDVKAGEVLAILDCREVGQAKLELVKSQLAANYAKAQHAWTQTTSQHAQEMVAAMRGETPIPEIEKRFKDRTVGDMRQQLMTAYIRRLEAKTGYERVLPLADQGAVPQSTVIRLRSEFETTEASFRALCEEVAFQAGQQVRASEQRFRDAKTTEALSKAALMMFGYTRDEVDAMDPLSEGSRVSLYTVRTPFAGTILEQHAVLGERVGPQIQMFQIADLSTVWLQVDVSQSDLPLVRDLVHSKIRFRIQENQNSLHEAEVFYTGDLLEKSTRASTLFASVQNSQRTYKPGMFVEVELTRSGAPALQIPLEAIQYEGRQPFVFLRESSDLFRRVDLKVGRTSGGVVEIIEGLRPGQSIAVAGAFVLKSELLKDQIAGD